MDEKELAIMKEVVEKLSLLEMDLYSICGVAWKWPSSSAHRVAS